MSSHDEHGHGKEPIILTSGRRMGKGLAIIVITMAIGAAIIVPFWDEMFANPPPVTQIRTERPPAEEPPAEAGTTTIAILQGAATQGNPDYDPDDAQVPLGNKIVWDNQDTVPHTATSGTGLDDPEMGAVFDTSFINGGEQSDPVETEGMAEGDVIDYFCTVHPYMTGKVTITAAGQGGEGGQEGGAAAGPTINILEGAAVQGSPDYDPDALTASQGDEITVVNQDTVPHTATSGTGLDDPEMGAVFDTGFINGGESATISLAEVDPGAYDYFCTVHPYMTGNLTVE